MNWDQLKTILWLRWRLSRNQLTRGSKLAAVVVAIVIIGAILFGGASFVGAFFFGRNFLGKTTPITPIMLWTTWLGLTVAFLFFWMIGLMQEIQRSETIDLQRLLHLPVSLGQVFTINYLASHFSFSLIVVLPAVLGLTLGLALSRGPAMLLMLPLALGMICTVTAWTYCLRGWLASLMSNPRRRRNVVMATVMIFILLAQLPNLYFNVFLRMGASSSAAKSAAGAKQSSRKEDVFFQRLTSSYHELLAFQGLIPPLWVPMGAQQLAAGDPVPAALGALGGFAIGALGLRRAYRSTLRQYQGSADGTPPKPGPSPAAAAAKAQGRPAPAAAPVGSRFMEWRLPWVPEQAAALALATFRSLSRAPEVKVALGSSILVPILVGGSLFLRGSVKPPDMAKPFIATGAVVFAVFMLAQFFANQFGFDRDGFRTLVLSPVDRRLILLGKNLACLPATAGMSALLFALVAWRLSFGPWLIAAAVFKLAAVLLCAAMGGNQLSIRVSYRIQAGSMKPTKMPGAAMFVLALCHLLFPFAMLPAFLPPLVQLAWRFLGWPGAGAVDLSLSCLLAMAAVLAYWKALAPTGRLLQARETTILAKISSEVE